MTSKKYPAYCEVCGDKLLRLNLSKDDISYDKYTGKKVYSIFLFCARREAGCDRPGKIIKNLTKNQYTVLGREYAQA